MKLFVMMAAFYYLTPSLCRQCPPLLGCPVPRGTLCDVGTARCDPWRQWFEQTMGQLLIDIVVRISPQLEPDGSIGLKGIRATLSYLLENKGNDRVLADI